MTRIAFLGTGTMGLPMARNLARAGLTVRAWNRTPERARPLEQDGVEIYGDPRSAATGSAVLVTALSDASAVLDSAAAALGALEDGGIWLQMSTIGIEGTALCASLAERHDVAFVDAPVLGTRLPAERGELVVLASGPSSALKACEGLFEAVGSRTMQVGQAGSGTRCKLVINAWVVGLTSVLAEAISLAEGLDVDPRLFLEAIEGGPLDVQYAHLKGELMFERAFDDPDFRLALARKDADLVLAAAEEAGIEIPVMHAVAERFVRAERGGHGDQDMAATYWASEPAAHR